LLGCGAPRARREDKSLLRRPFASKPGLTCRSKAMNPATCGQAADVPSNRPLPPESEKLLSGAVTSGLILRSSVGPLELYGSSCPELRFTAPTATAAREVAGTIMLPSAERGNSSVGVKL